MRERETFTSYIFQLVEVLVVKPEVPVVKPEVPVVRQFCHKKIDSDRFVSDHCLFPLKRGV